MTDRFVPDKPGLYWCRDYSGETTVAEIDDRRDMRVIGSQDIEDKYLVDWLAPVTPSDVVADLVAALETAINRQGFSNDELITARAAIRRYKEG